jgi:hypothetical protein
MKYLCPRCNNNEGFAVHNAESMEIEEIKPCATCEVVEMITNMAKASDKAIRGYQFQQLSDSEIQNYADNDQISDAIKADKEQTMVQSALEDQYTDEPWWI